MPRKKSGKKPVRLVCVSDLHIGSDRAPWPKGYSTEGGWVPSPALDWSEYPTACWEHFWNDWLVSRIGNEKFILVINGDTIEGDHHRNTQVITNDTQDQADAAIELLRPVVERASAYYQFRGTGCHVKRAEEQIARALGARYDKDEGTYASYRRFIDIHGRRFEFKHHTPMGSPRSDFTGLQRELTDTRFSYTTAGWQVPDVMVRGHRHRHAIASVNRQYVIVNPSWKMEGDYEHKVCTGVVAQLGGTLITVYPDGQVVPEQKIYWPDPPSATTEKVA